MAEVIRKAYVDTPSGQIHCRRVEGPHDPVVLLHRTPTGSASFEAMLRLLAGSRAAIALDTPGFGSSFTPDFMPAAPDYAAWALAALDAAGITRFHICAHHTGTHFGAELALLGAGRARSLLLSGVLYATAPERAALRAQIGTAPAVDAAGGYLSDTWALIKTLLAPFDAALCHRELVAALGSPAGRDQVFGAILTQDFAAVLARITCPVAVVQACDDPLNPHLARLREAAPAIPVEMIGPAGLAAPELQPAAYVARVLSFAREAEGAAPGVAPGIAPGAAGTAFRRKKA